MDMFTAKSYRFHNALIQTWQMLLLCFYITLVFGHDFVQEHMPFHNSVDISFP